MKKKKRPTVVSWIIVRDDKKYYRGNFKVPQEELQKYWWRKYKSSGR